MSFRARVVAVVGVACLSGCGVMPTGLVAVSVTEGRMTFAIIGCEGDVDNSRFVVTGPQRDDGRARVLGEWHTTEPADRRATFEPDHPGPRWITDQSLGNLSLTSDHLRAFATPSDASARGTDEVIFTPEELLSLTPGAWIYSVYESEGDTGDARRVNKIARSLDELEAAANRYSCLD
jgi:hypothetical protein